MNYGRFKKATIWLALTCVFALPVAATFTPPVSAQGFIAVTTDGRVIITMTSGGDDTRIAPGQ